MNYDLDVLESSSLELIDLPSIIEEKETDDGDETS